MSRTTEQRTREIAEYAQKHERMIARRTERRWAIRQREHCNAE